MIRTCFTRKPCICKKNKERKQNVQIMRRPREIQKKMLPLALFMGMHKEELTNNVQTKASAKRSQHVNATYCNIVDRNMLRAFGHHVATRWVFLAQVSRW